MHDFGLLADVLAAVQLFGQKFEPHDALVVGLLILLEGVLSIDNALVLGLLAKRLPKNLQGKALTYGLVGAFVFRIIAIATASFLLRWTLAKFLGGAYLVYVAVKHFVFEPKTEKTDNIAAGADGWVAPAMPRPSLERQDGPITCEVLPTSGKPSTHGYGAFFWQTVLVIELTDIAFAVDSIVAAMAMVGTQRSDDTGAHDKLWVVVTGGMLGVILMRFAAVIFIKLLERFPRFEVSAYLLVLVIGSKLLLDWGFNRPGEPSRLDFHDYSHPAFWLFWVLMLLCFAFGFIPGRHAADGNSLE